MSTTAGSFSETALLNQRVRADEIMFDDRIKAEFTPQIDALAAINQAATATIGSKFNIKDAADGKKRVTVEVDWMNSCGITRQDVSPCTIGGAKLSTNKQEYTMDISREWNFTVAECDFIDNEFGMNEAVSRGYLEAERQLAEYLVQTFITRIDAAAGINVFTGDPGTVVANLTTIPAAYWSAELLAYFNKVAKLNKFGKPIFLSGSNLYTQALIAEYNAGNSNGSGANSMYKAMNMNFDLFNIDSVIGQRTLMINTGSIAWATKSFYSREIQTMSDGKKRWMDFSKAIPNVELMLEYQNECDDCGLYKHHYKVAVGAGFFVNPVGCDLNNNGILTFACA